MKKINSLVDDGKVDVYLIKKFSEDKNIKFPISYINLVSEHNEMQPVESIFDFINISTGRKDERDISFLGFGCNGSVSEKIQNSQDFDVYGHENVVAFGHSANGDYICFDYRDNPATNEPKVVVMFHDCADENNKMLICPVADSFEQFVDSLYRYEDE